jgi:hypothetical protein
MEAPMSRRTVALSVFVLIAFVACAVAYWDWSMKSVNPKLDLTHNLHFDVYDAGKIVRSGDLPADSPARVKLKKLLEDDTVKWKKSYVTFAPRILIKGQKFSITLQPSRIIVNYDNGDGKWIQVTRELPNDFLAGIQKDVVREK